MYPERSCKLKKIVNFQSNVIFIFLEGSAWWDIIWANWSDISPYFTLLNVDTYVWNIYYVFPPFLAMFYTRFSLMMLIKHFHSIKFQGQTSLLILMWIHMRFLCQFIHLKVNYVNMKKFWREFETEITFFKTGYLCYE